MDSKGYGWKPSPGWFVIKPGAHQCHRLNDAQSVLQAPAQQDAVTRRHKNSRARKRFPRGNQRLQVCVGFCRGMAEKREMRRVSGDAASALYHACGALFNCLRQLDASIESVNVPR